MRAALTALLRRFARDTRGSISVEFVLVMPALFWAFMASYVFFDGYRQSVLNLKAAYSIGDMVSRETEAVNDTYIDSMAKVLSMMTRSATKLRISVVRWDADDNRYYVDWSETRGFDAPRTDADMLEIADKLPLMPHNERVILVETEATYEPPFAVGIGTKHLDNFVFTSLRFGPQLAWSDS
ncbi:TadE/TadG family type IV pilus assembly protein [Pseudodonghicola flavimaris]|uniref:Pilus assembly protein n=1 Tax=Pseudodonghicola flavimaris TaxID=3050036 RepID=A0ABT7F4D7_9RHOB|nr:pilus assembly protein [Pseudodonghicola flavimaris]MDK3019478.1 pilus assembly protein [Pseudodonghicola flavimaris]